ncbi:MAG: PepSY domain-containing protein [Clostridia bacterium]|nr:PepSY domain-containing protein [Clostridia bacterium]
MDNNSDNYVSSNDSETPLESELMPSQNNNSSLNETAKITKEEAKKIALKDAGVTENEIRDFEIELDRDNDILKYEISFEKGNDDYDYDIDANTGKIINKEKDIND